VCCCYYHDRFNGERASVSDDTNDDITKGSKMHSTSGSSEARTAVETGASKATTTVTEQSASATQGTTTGTASTEQKAKKSLRGAVAGGAKRAASGVKNKVYVHSQ
jgi:hypothetical protein